MVMRDVAKPVILRNAGCWISRGPHNIIIGLEKHSALDSPLLESLPEDLKPK